MEAALPHHPVFLSPPPRHLAELRIEAAPSAVAFSAPCAAAGRKRRCLLPASSPRKRMLLELHPFGSYSPPSPTPTPTPSPRQSSSGTASDFSFPSATPWTGGARGGCIFAFQEHAVTTPSPKDSNTSALSSLASPARPVTPTGSTASCGVALWPSPKVPMAATVPNVSGGLSSLSPSRTTPPRAGPTATGGFVFMAPPEDSLTPTGSNATGGIAFLSPEPSFSPSKDKDIGAVASIPTPMPSPRPSFRHTDSPASPATPAFVFSAQRTTEQPVRKSRGGRICKKRPRPDLPVATARQQEEQQPASPPPQKVAKTAALATSEVSRSSFLPVSSTRPCCTFFASPTKAPKQEAKKASSEASHSSPAGSRCSLEKANKREQEVEVSSVGRECPTSPAARSGAVVTVRVTCTCGVHKDFSFDHCY